MPSRPDPPGGDGVGTGRRTPVATVVIPTHDAEATLAEQLTALVGQVEAPPFDVIVVLNRCTDGSGTVAERFTDRLALTIVIADERAGVAHARNVGWHAARAPFVLICDADDRVAPAWVAGPLNPLLRGVADLVGARPVVEQDELVGARRSLYDFGYRHLDGVCVHAGQVPWVFGGASWIRREALEEEVEDVEEEGGYVEEFDGVAHEEIAFARRAIRAGNRIAPAPRATFRYRPRATFGEVGRPYRSVVRGWPLDALRQGAKLVTPRSTAHHRWRTRRKAVRLVRRFGLGRPLDLVRAILWRYHQGAFLLEFARDERSFSRDDAARSSGIEATAPVELPRIGGRLITVTVWRQVAPEATAGQRAVLALIEAFVEPGTLVVDVGTGPGLLGVAAAVAVGPQGCVELVEPDETQRRLVRLNLERHRVPGTCSLEERFVAVSGRPRAAAVFVRVAADRIDSIEFDAAVAEALAAEEALVAVEGYPGRGAVSEAVLQLAAGGRREHLRNAAGDPSAPLVVGASGRGADAPTSCPATATLTPAPRAPAVRADLDELRSSATAGFAPMTCSVAAS